MTLTAIEGLSLRRRPVVRWLTTFAGFPLGGLASMLLVGRVDSPAAAAFGGLLTGAILGAVQAWGLGADGPSAKAWGPATALGLGLGLVVGAGVVDFGTTATDLLVQGAICGFTVGAAQAVVLRPRLGRIAAVWPVALSASWTVGWAATTLAGVEVDQQFTVFGSIGAVLVAALTTVLPLALRRVRSGS